MLPHWRRWAKLRTQLYPYLAAADAEYRRSGMPIMRQLALAYPDDPSAAAQRTSSCSARTCWRRRCSSRGATRDRVYLPRGDWVDLWRSAAYGETDGGLRLGPRACSPVAARRRCPAPLDELPLLARAGAVLRLLPPDVDTLASYGDDDGLVRLRDRADQLELLAFPRGHSVSRFYDDGRIASIERPGRWTLRVRGNRGRSCRAASLARHVEAAASPLPRARRRPPPARLRVGLPRRRGAADRAVQRRPREAHGNRPRRRPLRLSRGRRRAGTSRSHC